MKEQNFAGNSRQMVDFMGKEWHYDCLGCAIRDGKVIPPGGILYETNSFTIQLDAEIPIKGFLIINTKQHIRSLVELKQEERAELIELIDIAMRAVKTLTNGKEITLVQEERSKHFHVWIFPHDKWMDEKFGKGISNLREICAYAQKNASLEERKEVEAFGEKIKRYLERMVEE